MHGDASILTSLSRLQIKDQHSAYLRKELTAMRDKYIPDTRIHCCVFFINPTGHTLKPVSLLTWLGVVGPEKADPRSPRSTSWCSRSWPKWSMSFPSSPSQTL